MGLLRPGGVLVAASGNKPEGTSFKGQSNSKAVMQTPRTHDDSTVGVQHHNPMHERSLARSDPKIPRPGRSQADRL